MPDLVVAGAGMAGLVAAAEARAQGANPLLVEKLERPGGSLLLSSGVVWRHRELDDFRADCPDGDPDLQRVLYERLDGDLDWLLSLGAPAVAAGTGNPLTTGFRLDPLETCAALLRAAGGARLGAPLAKLPEGTPVVLATGGFQADRGLVRDHVTPEADHLMLRSSRGSAGDGLRLGLEAGAATSAGMEQIYGRNMPAPPARVESRQFVALAQLYAHHAEIVNERGERYEPRTWSEIDVLQWTARQPRARVWFRVPREALGQQVRDRTVADMVQAATDAGAPVRLDSDAVVVETVAGITSTLGGLRIDASARAAPGIFACGGDAGDIATGGYSSGLAAALVFGRIAARSALGLD
jgi:succinate dehydrogenase/fumarate reductase flavoprotein subunit